MKLKHKLLLGYFAIGLLFAVYSTFFGDTSNRGFAFNLGQGVVWPAVMFLGLGKVIGALVLVAFIALVVYS
jgi:hypothetical protein